LYRILKTFVESSIAHQIDDGTGYQIYYLEAHCNCEMDTDLHPHFYCTNCNEAVRLTEHKIPHINLPEGFKAENVYSVVKGICNKCNGQ
tara:strand:+ start:462 stop:728 length:267 start_codon:yes stop_codon:yes gene_type:complete